MERWSHVQFLPMAPGRTQPGSGDKENVGEMRPSSSSSGSSDLLADDNKRQTILSTLQQRLSSPKDFALSDNNNNNNVLELLPHQFLHQHHMKTAGTSLDIYLQCATDRLRHDQSYTIHHTSIHECNPFYYERCKNDTQGKCHQRIRNASMMSYCAPLADLTAFGWRAQAPAYGAVTLLRHPVDRVWSMFRFETLDCYHCKSLLDIYAEMDQQQQQQQQHKGSSRGTDLEGWEPHCLEQIQNHQVTNLLYTPKEELVSRTDDEILAEAFQNLQSFFTVIGLTERMNDTLDVFGTAFPWMQRQVDWSSRRCRLSHTNGSPSNNLCGANHSHWDLPLHPDEATRKAIEDHNQLDLRLYSMAMEYFDLQLQALTSVRE
eukprot:Nitzschia sp. Nitz4//scaffold181_size46380//24151//25275//NITZ4_007177-RA/size46380-processed-gene-0.32-mRNA-1//-1//CDS//3329539510//6869//frame0